MDRRDFLKILGLSGVALTVPKPLDVIAAKMADLESPPLHIGHGTIRVSEKFFFHSFGMKIERGLSLKHYVDFENHWHLKFFIRKGEDLRTRVLWASMPVSHVPNPDAVCKTFDDEVLEVPHYWVNRVGRLWYPDEVGEIWIVPDDVRNLPIFPLPRLSFVIQGTVGENTASSTLWTLQTPISTVQIDRARAIEAGLVSPSEPEGVIV